MYDIIYDIINEKVLYERAKQYQEILETEESILCQLINVLPSGSLTERLQTIRYRKELFHLENEIAAKAKILEEKKARAEAYEQKMESLSKESEANFMTEYEKLKEKKSKLPTMHSSHQTIQQLLTAADSILKEMEESPSREIYYRKALIYQAMLNVSHETR